MTATQELCVYGCGSIIQYIHSNKKWWPISYLCLVKQHRNLLLAFILLWEFPKFCSWEGHLKKKTSQTFCILFLQNSREGLTKKWLNTKQLSWLELWELSLVHTSCEYEASVDITNLQWTIRSSWTVLNSCEYSQRKNRVVTSNSRQIHFAFAGSMNRALTRSLSRDISTKNE